MTVKEVSEVLNVSDRTVRRHAKDMGLTSNGLFTELGQNDITEIKKRIEKSGRTDLANVVQVSNINTDVEMVEKARDVMAWLDGKVRQLTEEKKDLQIQLDQEKQWYSVKRIKALGYLPDIKVHNIWRPLKKWCIENDYQIISIFDANYGDVKTYHADSWKAVYGLDLYFKGEIR
jgi:hypothetical protein